jgi:plastocyanin
MNSLHPHWQSTEDEQPVPVRSVSQESAPSFAGTSVISRKPAAIMGIVLVSALLLAYFHSASSLTGQVADGSPIVVITEKGMEPKLLNAALGDNIKWTNEDTTPHILTSDTLCNDNRECLSTPTIFPGDEATFVIPMDITPGIYSYNSVIDSDVKGEINISAAAAITTEGANEEPAYRAPEQKHPVKDPAPSFPNNFGFVPDKPKNIDSPPTIETTPETSGIPTNPNSGKSFAMPTTSAVQPNAHTGAPPVVTGHRPISQPQTGAGTWVVVLMFIASVAGLMWRTRKAQ